MHKQTFVFLGLCAFLLMISWAGDSASAQESNPDVPVTEVDSVSVDSLNLSDIVPALPAPIPEPPRQLKAKDVPNDGGGAIQLTWEKSQDDGEGRNLVHKYIILRSTSASGSYEEIGEVSAGTTEYTDHNVENQKSYFYKVQAVGATDEIRSRLATPVEGMAKPQWFNSLLLNILLGVIIFSGLVLWYTAQAQRRELFVRRIPGLSAVGEAIGRATEMGRPVLYVPGIGVISNIQTLASLAIMGEVAKITAEYDTKLIVPCRDPIVMTAADETVREGYLDAGRLDAYSPENVRFLTEEQFAYVAGVNGIMLREHPAANLYLGEFYAESLILAETGFSAGAIQVAGTAMVAQIPFFIAACDYTLIGEELFAASAYLSRDPRLIASLKSSDIGKAIFVVLMLLGVLMSTMNVEWYRALFAVN
ncbi:MAG: fibronectin type III domain-containing protein [Gemmatimonadetes bacterium]|nr:MAG: fibronectin type III domain-containing protein [Gemmatimonadota bacterium]